MTTTPFAVSARERMLRALEAVLGTIPGVKHVSRQAISSDMVSAPQLPAILISEERTTYTWATARQAQGRKLMVSSAIALDLQIGTRRGRGHELGESSAREAFVDEVLQTLIDNPELEVALEDGAEPEPHCRDAFAGAAQVRYVPGSGEYARAIVVIRVDLEATYERRSTRTPNTLLVELAAHDAAGDGEFVDELVVDVNN